MSWRYTLRDLTDADDPEVWAKALAAEGWRLWIPGNTGAETVINGRRVRRYSRGGGKATGTLRPPSQGSGDKARRSKRCRASSARGLVWCYTRSEERMWPWPPRH